ncbi:MAG: hypothetical protein JNM84_28230 [Planctomycetes bacterium]|nr:hypothetical protein [Planctomycetota bacterium]
MLSPAPAGSIRRGRRGSSLDRASGITCAKLASSRRSALRGSTSIKIVLPALVPELADDDLEIRNGGKAVAAFFRLADGGIDADEAERLRRELLAYCERDTLAMVRLHEVLARRR